MKTLALLLFVAVSVVNAQGRSIEDVLKNLKPYTSSLENSVNIGLMLPPGISSFQDLPSTSPYHQPITSVIDAHYLRLLLAAYADMGIGIAGGAGEVKWKNEEGVEATAQGGEVEIKFGSCSTNRHPPEGDGSTRQLVQKLKEILAGIPGAIVTEQYPENVFRGFGHGEVSVANRDDDQITPSCDHDQMKNATVTANYVGYVEGTEIILSSGTADACEPTKGVGVAKGTGITGSGKINATADVFAMSFGNAEDLASSMFN